MDNTIERTEPPRPGPDSGGLETKITRFERQLADQRDQLRDYEKSLVERIADVDDDRRTTAAKLQRAWQTQREEIDDRLRRHRAGSLGTLILFALLFFAALFFLFRHLESGQQPIRASIAEIENQLDTLGAAVVDQRPSGDALGTLSSAVDGVSASLQELEERQDANLRGAIESERSARDKALAAVGAEIRALEAEQQRLTSGLESLRKELQAVWGASEATRAVAPVEPAGPATTDSEEAPAAPVLPAAADTAQASAASPSAREPATPERAPGPDDGGEVSETEETPAPQADEGESPLALETEAIGERAYALQLIGFFSRDALIRFARQQALPPRVFYREDMYKGRPWFALIHSLHAEYADAEAERARLPAELADLDPWIRPLSGGDLVVLETVASP